MHQGVVKFLKYALLLQGKSGSLKLPRNDGTRYKSHNHIPLFWNQISLRSTCSNIIGESDLLLEDGMDIQELPVIVRKITEAHIPGPFKKLKEKLNPTENFKQTGMSQDREVKEMIEGFDKCYTQRSVFTLLELIPPAEITPSVALQALKTIIKFENSQEFKSKFDFSVDDDESETLYKNTVINNLIDIIATSDENNEILESLQLVCEEMTGDNVFLFRQKLCDEVLIRIADDKFSISEICSSARSLLFSGNQVDIDKLWVGVMERQRDIDEKNIMEVFRILLHVNLSRSLLLKILQKQLEIVSLKLKDENIAEILSILNEIKEFPYYIIQCLSNWLNIKVLKTSEEKLGSIIEGFMLLPNLEEDVVKALEKFIKAKKLNIKNPELVGIIMEYCNQYKIRSPLIFDTCSEYLVQNAKSISPSVLKSIFLPFGNLNYQPKNNLKFWRVLEEELLEKFVQLYSEDALDIMLCFTFLENHPIKFITKIFNPYFLGRLHSLKNTQWIHLVRTKLKLLDTALTLECKLYEGPLLLPDMSSSLIKQDSRIQRISDFLLDVLPVIVGPEKSTASSVVLKNLPLTELYIVDIIIHPKGKPSLLYPTSWNEFTALLIHLPEHYDSSGKHLTGLQVMRKRHLRRIGLNVVDLDYNIINTLLSNDTELKEYLTSQMSNPEHAFPS